MKFRNRFLVFAKLAFWLGSPGNLEESVKSRVNRIVALANHAQINIGAQNTAQAIDQLEILDDGTEAVAADFSIECFDDDLDVIAAEGWVELVVLQAL